MSVVWRWKTRQASILTQIKLKGSRVPLGGSRRYQRASHHVHEKKVAEPSAAEGVGGEGVGSGGWKCGWLKDHLIYFFFPFPGSWSDGLGSRSLREQSGSLLNMLKSRWLDVVARKSDIAKALEYIYFHCVMDLSRHWAKTGTFAKGKAGLACHCHSLLCPQYTLMWNES